MKPGERATARRQIDNKLIPLQKMDYLARPPKGWLRAIREALGLTTRQLAQRLGVSQTRAFEIEKAEVSGSITLESLRRAAEALDCRLVYALVPVKPLETIAEERALSVARRRLKSTRHTMALEGQSVAGDDEEAQVKRLAEKLLAQPGSSLWDEA
jgi:predicted DNA-binding mobile mystery protein A